MAAKKAQRPAGAVCAAFVFLLMWGLYIPSSQATCWITIDGVQRQTTLETSRTIQAAQETSSILAIRSPCGYFNLEGNISADCFSLELDEGFEHCTYSACLNGTWSSEIYCAHPSCRLYSSGTWDVICECLQDSDCDDGAFCNGTETCVDTACVAGSPPCSEAQVCDEDNDRCVECISSADCDDGELCNTSSGVCVECLAQGDCSVGYECREGVCMPKDSGRG